VLVVRVELVLNTGVKEVSVKLLMYLKWLFVL
jgi:hypothetical protein